MVSIKLNKKKNKNHVDKNCKKIVFSIKIYSYTSFKIIHENEINILRYLG